MGGGLVGGKKLEGKWDVKFRKGMAKVKAGSRGDPAGDVGMTECQGNPASTPKVSPTYRPTAKWMAAWLRQGYGHAGFEGGAGVGWQKILSARSLCPGMCAGMWKAELANLR